MSTAADEAAWVGFKKDAARVIGAEARFEEAIAETLEHPFDEPALDRVTSAVEGLKAARPSALRLAGLDGTGSF